MEAATLFDEGMRFYHDPDLHYEITAEKSVRVDPATGQCVMYLGMRDYLKDGERYRKSIEFVYGPPILMAEPIDDVGDTKWEGVTNITWVPKGIYAYYGEDCITDPEKISEHYSPTTVVSEQDGVIVRTAFVFGKDTNARYNIKNSVTLTSRQVSAYNVTSVSLNKNEYICSIKSATGSRFLKKLESGRENALKITITFDLAYDFTNDQRGINIMTMSDTIAQIKETKLT